MPKSIACTDRNPGTHIAVYQRKIAITFGGGVHKLQLCTGGRAQKHKEVKTWLQNMCC